MSKESPGFIRRSWRALNKPSARYSILGLLIVGFVGGIIFWGGFNTGLEATNTLPFCISCHEMRDNVYVEYKDTIHYSNRTGVRAICSDCHVPHAWGPKMIRKSRASLEVWGKLTGSIDTREKFEAKRMELATIEWARMKANNSRECRNCHSLRRDEQGRPEAKRLCQAHESPGRGPGLHRLPQGHRAPFAEGIQGPGRVVRCSGRDAVRPSPGTDATNGSDRFTASETSSAQQSHPMSCSAVAPDQGRAGHGAYSCLEVALGFDRM